MACYRQRAPVGENRFQRSRSVRNLPSSPRFVPRTVENERPEVELLQSYCSAMRDRIVGRGTINAITGGRGVENLETTEGNRTLDHTGAGTCGE